VGEAGQMLVQLDDADARLQAAPPKPIERAEADLNAVQGGAREKRS